MIEKKEGERRDAPLRIFLIALRKLLDLEVSVSNHEDGGESCDSCAAGDDVEGW